jgi:hypothetical protein
VIHHYIAAIRSVLTDDLLKPEFRKGRHPGAHPTTGHCYAASEALYHLCGGPASGLVPTRAKDAEGVTQYLSRGLHPPYQDGRGGGFLTRDPSKRAREIILRVRRKLA